MHRLRLVWQLHLDALQLLRSRLRALRERGPWVSLIIGFLFLPTVAMAFLWALNGGDPQYISAWAIYLSAQVAGVLRHPFNPRKPVVHPLPAWYFWAVQVLCVSGAVLLSLQSAWTPALGETFPRLPLHGILLVLAALTLLTTALPALLAHLEALAGRRESYRWFRSASNLYFLVLLFGAAGLATALGPVSPPINLAINSGIVLIFLIPAVLLHRKLWRRDSSPLLAVLPQSGFWTFFVVVTLEGGQFVGMNVYSRDQWIYFIVVGLVAEYTATFYYLVLLLRVSPVESLDRTNLGDEALSVQTDPDQYVDTSGHGARLLAFIRRSDGGVLGLTGVRGAGKSALIAHLTRRLQQQRQHFVLEMTAPVRHDPGLGFLSAVCRAVCRRVLDDMHWALYGRETEEGRARSEILKRSRNLGVAVAFLLLASLALVELREVAQATPARAREPGEDLCSALSRTEITMADDLLRQVNHVVAEGERSTGGTVRSLHYQIVPNRPGFAILTEIPQSKMYYHLDLIGLSRFTYIDVLGWEPEDSLNLELFGWVEGRDQNILIECSVSNLTGYSMQSLHQFFQGITGALPTQQPQLKAANAFDFPHPDWLSFLLIERFSASAVPPLSFEQLRAFRSLLVNYRNSFEGYTIPAAAPSGEGEPETPFARVGLALVEPAWIVLPLILVLIAGGPIWRVLSSLARAVANWRFVALYREAQQLLELLNYSESLEAKGSLSWKAVSLERSRSLAARDLTLPGLTARYVEFVQSVRRHYNGKLIIAIDELDKIHDPEMAKALLAEIKGALFTKGCYYLISISEDARRAFRQRLSSGRDIFESTFDDIIEVPQMSVEAASSMIERRLETSPEKARIPVSCHFVLALAGGGIPREIVRHLRAISLAHEDDASSLQPGPIATEIFRFEVRDWEAGLAEAELSGEETIKLRAEAKEILALLRDADFGRPACHRVWDHLERCLGLIDPAKLRRSVTLFPNIATDDKDTPHAVLRYQAILDDIQSCLRLMILTTVCEMAWREGETWKEHETALLAAYRALADKPALAETLLGEIRAALGGSACEGETTGGVSETATTAPG